MKYCAIDFEYTNGHLAHPTLVCACLDIDGKTERYWLYDGTQTLKLKERISELKNDAVFIAHAVELAEGRCFIELGFTDADFRWYDTMLVENLLTNVAKSERISLSLVDTLSRRGLIEEDTEAVKKGKDEMRRIIIEQDGIEEHKWAILDYCASDISLLKKLVAAQLKELDEMLKNPNKIAVCGTVPTNAGQVALDYSHNAWLFSIIDSRGIPLQVEEVEKFLKGSAQGSFLLKENFNADVGRIYEFKTTKRGGVKKVKATAKMALIQELISDIVAKNNIVDWPRSPKTQKYSLKDEVLKNYEHLDERIEKFRRHKSTTKMLASFVKDGEDNWLSSYDANVGRVFAYHGYGMTQTFRNKHRSKSGFVPAWSKAMRTLLMPPQGKVLVGVDYSSEEFVLGMDIYGDLEGVNAYQMGDIYLATAEKLSLIPHGAKKGDILPNGERVKDIRQRVKGLVLGIGYGMGYKSLAKKIGVTNDEAKDLMNAYKSLYHTTFDTQKELKRMLKNEEKYLMLPNGYTILARGATGRIRDDGSDINATLSSINWPVQAAGSYILQSIVKRCFAEGLKIVITMHDEVVIETDADNAEEDGKRLASIMIDAYEELTGTRNVRVGEPEIWGVLNDGSVKRCDHNEDGCKAYNELLELVSQDIEDDVRYESNAGTLYVDDIDDDNNKNNKKEASK